MKLPDFPTLHFGRSRRLPLVTQSEAAECGLACIAMVAGYHGYEVDLLTLRQRFSFSSRGATLKNLVDVGRALGLSARPIKVELDDLRHLQLPCILHWNLNHFVVLDQVRTHADGSLASILIHDPAHGRATVKAAAVDAAFTGVALELLPAANFERGEAKQQIKIGELIRSAVGLRPALLQVFGLSLALELFALLSPLLMQLVVDGPITSADRDMLTVVAFGFAMLMLFQTAFAAFRSWMVLYISTHLNLQWTANVFAHLLHLPLSFFEKRSLGDVTSRFNSVGTIQEKLSATFIETVLDGLLIVTVYAALLAYNVQLTAVVSAAIAAYCMLRSATFVATRRASEEQLTVKAREQSIFLESIRGIQAIKLLNHEGERHARWLNLLADTINRNIVIQKLALFFTTASNLLKGVENIAVVWLGARLVIDNTMSVGMLYAFIAYKTMLSTRAYALVDKLQDLKMLSLQGERLADIVLTPREDADGIAGLADDVPHDLTIELKGVSFRYSDVDPWILRGLDLTIRTGESVAIVGRSGCGKTTLLKLLIGILAPTEGEILVGGIPLSRFGVRRYRALIGAVMQDDQLFAGTVAENIAFFDQQADPAAIARSAEAASIARDLEAMPMGYQTLIGDMGSSLSGGQKQRLLLARALFKAPSILFLDEATSHLDTANERSVNEAIRHMQISRVIVAHRQETIASVGRVVELADGKVIRDFEQGARPLQQAAHASA
jgi:ATP-binding cassette subfamily B protein RaxB